MAASALKAAQARAQAARSRVSDHTATIATQRELLEAVKDRPDAVLLRADAEHALAVARQQLDRDQADMVSAEAQVKRAHEQFAAAEAELGLAPDPARRCTRCGGTGRYSFRRDVGEMCLRCAGTGDEPARG